MSTDQLSMSMFATRADYDAAVRAQADQLPDGLQLAVNIIRESEWPEGGNPLDAVLNEHAQRLTLQHHAADQAWRIADLEVKCVTLKDLHDAAADERDELRARMPAQLPDIELVSAKVHQAWMETKLAQGIHSRTAADGTEQMVPYESLPDALQELDRSTVRAVYAAIAQATAAPEHKA